MAWETRKRGGRYYYRAIRDGARVRKKYVGTGYEADLIARLDHLDRVEKQLVRAKAAAHLDELRAQIAVVEEAAAPLRDAALQAFDEAMRAAGYHQHKGEWRKRREQGKGRGVDKVQREQ
jgi:hypothetical protein